MKLKNVLIAVNDIERSKAFYKELFGLEVILDQGENVILTEGLVLQETAVWKKCIERDVAFYHNASELYFEEADMEGFIERLEHYQEPIEYVSPPAENLLGQKLVRFYDPDGNLIEVKSL